MSTKDGMQEDGHGGENVLSMGEICIQGWSPVQQIARALEGIVEDGQDYRCILDYCPTKIQHSQESLKSRFV